MGSASDWESLRPAAEMLDKLGIAHEVRVVSAHRTPDLLFEYASTAAGRGLEVLIAGAGGAAHLPGMLASVTPLPVIGVPVPLQHLDGMDSLLSIVQMPAGVPVATVLASWLDWRPQSLDVLRHLASTVLLEYTHTSLRLCLMVALGVALVGSASAVTVTLFDFRGRKLFTWALLLPLAVPSYVVAYAYTDFLQYAGPFQTWLRQATGQQGRMFPEVRSLGGAAWVFVFTLYPYVYVLARTALAERASHLMEAARMLGAPLPRRIARVALPLARPAIAAGVLLALMETLADYGVGSYFGIQTLTTGIYKAWLALDNRVAAAQLASVLLVLVMLLLQLERRSQSRMRFAAGRNAAGSSARALPLGPRGTVLAWVVCGFPLLAGFVLPVAFMLRPLAADWGV